MNKANKTAKKRGNSTYAYDANGKLITETTRDGKIISYTYDALGRETSRSVSIGGEVQTTRTTTYDAAGRILSVSENGYTVTNTYRPYALSSVTESDGSHRVYSYDYDNLCIGYTLTLDGTTTDSASYTYDSMRRLTGVTTGGVTVSYGYNTLGQKVRETIDGERDLVYTYNRAGLLTNVEDQVFDYDEDNIVIYRHGESYTYYTDGTARTKGGITYTYDALGRLVRESGSYGTISYTYDARGNRTQMVKGSVTTNYTYNKANQLLTETAPGVSKVYTYDNAGNLTTVTQNGLPQQTYTYDAWGRQIGYTAGWPSSYCKLTNPIHSINRIGLVSFVDKILQIAYDNKEDGRWPDSC